MINEKLDPKNYCGGVAPVGGGDGYSDFRSDYDFSPEYLAQKEAHLQAMLDAAPDYIKREIAERQKQ